MAKRSPEHTAKIVAARRANGSWFKATDIGERIRAGKAAGRKPDVRGPKNGNWRGGLTKLRQGWRGGTEYAAWRTIVLSRAGHACERCGAIKNVIAHHIKSWHEAPSLRTDPANGIALCRKCHAHEHQLIVGLPGPWPDRPSVTTILCRYCGGPKAVPTKNVTHYSTCGAPACVRQRIRDGVAKPKPAWLGQGNPNYRTGKWTSTKKTCPICQAEFVGPAKRVVCSLACAAKRNSALTKGVRLSDEHKAAMRGVKRTRKREIVCATCGLTFLGFHVRKHCYQCRPHKS